MYDTADVRGMRVLGGKHGASKIGKVRCAVFHPQTHYLVGYLVKRPDFAFIKARSDWFLALDSLRIIEGNVVGYADSDAWNQSACKRLKLNLDTCILLEGMPAMSEGSLQAFGIIASARYNEQTGELESIKVSDGVTAEALLGARVIPQSSLIGYRDGVVWVRAGAEQAILSGGLAAKAGAQVAVIGDKVSKIADKAGARAEEATTEVAIKAGRSIKRVIDKGSEQIEQRQNAASETTASAVEQSARAVGRQLGASKRMFGSFREEYRKAAATGNKQARTAGQKKK